jgi:hypothetical protein
LSKSNRNMVIYRSGINSSPQVMSLDMSFFSFTAPNNIVCSRNSILVYGPDIAPAVAGGTVTNDIAILNTDFMDNPFKRLLTILKNQQANGLVTLGLDTVFLFDKHVTLNPKFFVQSIGDAKGLIPVELTGNNGFNTTNIKFGVNVNEIVEILTVRRVGVFLYQEGKTIEFEKTTPITATRRILDDVNGAEITGAVYSMVVSGVKKTAGVDIANIQVRGDELGKIVCKGGLILNGEPLAAANPSDLGDIRSDDTIVDAEIKGPIGAIISVTNNTPPKYFLNVYKEPEVLRTRLLIPYACSRVALESTADFNFAFVAMHCENRMVVIRKASVSPSFRSEYIASYQNSNQITGLEIFSAATGA